jgi:excisionase family DNA binding protein
MTATTLNKAKQTLTSKIADRLSNSLLRSGVLASGKPEAMAAFGSASKAILEGLLSDRESVVALESLLEVSAKAVRVEDPWLKTEEAARKMGFSRPYVAALIDAGEFGASASKSVKGHRRVKASSVEKWLRDHAASPEKKAQAESSEGMGEFFDAPALQAAEEAALSARIKHARGQSLAHRPTRKRA